MASKSKSSQQRKENNTNLFVTGELSGIKGRFKNGLVPEIKIRYNKGKRVLGKVKTSKDVADFVRSQYARGSIDTQEFFNVLFLNKSNSIAGYYQHSKGGVSGTVVDSKLIFSIALKSLSTGIILSHNHPSGNTRPSRSDISITKRINKAAQFLEINLLDHVIITKSSYFSFADEGML